MDHFEKVEKLKEKAGVSYEEAKAALEACNWDMLDAIVFLEKKGKVNGPENTSYSTQYEEPEHFEQASSQYTENSTSFGGLIKRFLQWCGNVIKKGNEHYFDIERKGEHIVSIPITILVILVIITFWAVAVLLIVGLFFGFRYRFRGPDFKPDTINNVMDKASKTAENIKNDIKTGFSD